MKNKIKKLGIGVALVLAMVFSAGMVTSTSSYAIECEEGYTLQGGVCVVNPGYLPTDMNVIIKNIVNTLLYVLGALSVIMLIYGGFRYTTSGGNANSVTAAKNTILYAVVGIVVALLSYAIVNFVIFSLTKAA